MIHLSQRGIDTFAAEPSIIWSRVVRNHDGVGVESPQFDPGGFYEFNIRSGAVNTRDGHRVIVLSEDVLAPLVAAAAASGDLTPMRTLGANLADHAKASFGVDLPGADPEAVLGHASTVLALFGWGQLTMEKWGDALVLCVASLPKLDDRSLAVAAMLGGFMGQLSGQEVACVPAGEGCFVVVNPAIADAVWNVARQGGGVSSVVNMLEAV